MKKLTLTIIIPAYNEENYIGVCLESISRQTVKPDEVILVDNNSTDATVKIARSYSFVKIVHEPHQGRYAARQKGFEAASSVLIGQIDADTRLWPNWTQVVKDYFAVHPEVDAISGTGWFYNFRFKKLGSLLHAFIYYHLQAVITGGMTLWGGNMVIRRQPALRAWSQTQDYPDTDEDICLSIILKRLGYKIKYARRMLVGVSLLRDNFDLKHTKEYLDKWDRDYAVYGLRRQALMIRLLKPILLVMASVFFGFRAWRQKH